MKTLNEILEGKGIAIIRGYRTEDAVRIARALKKGGVTLLEVTLNSPDALRTIRELSNEPGMTVGAGTVLDGAAAQGAIEAGARFILSPTLKIETIRTAKRYGVISIPGAYTPSEILTAFEEGADIVKVFPATALGPSFIKDMQGPLPQVRLLPTGGVTVENATTFLEAGAVGVGLGSSLVHRTEHVDDAYLNEIEMKAKRFRQLTMMRGKRT
ncbi:bifunctional 4-hydroxy-2-oxoglutarate aldolase/2-dehydro-3-deoxy-phosphogluconate aldolase [Bacillus sp. SLBN-3]